MNKVNFSPHNESKTSFPSEVSINLLPEEIILRRKHSSKLSLINKLSIMALVTLVFSSALTLAFRISQTLELSQAQQGLVYAQGKVLSLQDKEGSMIVLKQRLSLIQSLMGVDSKRKMMFTTVLSNLPADIKVSEASVDKSGGVFLSLTTASLSSIEELILSLSSPEKNRNLISKINLDGLSYGQDQVFRFGLKVAAH